MLSNSHRFILITILLLTFIRIGAQSKMEYGIGIGIHYGDYSEDYIFETDIKIPDIDKSKFLPNVQLRSAYILNERWKLSLNPSIVWKGANQVFGSQTYTGIYADFPILAHFEIIQKLHFFAGPVYSHVLFFTIEQDGQKMDVTNSIPEKSIFAGFLGVAYDLNDYMELNLSAHSDISDAIVFRYEDDFGVPIGKINLRNQYIQLSLVFRK